jgi:hypothetical protein
MKREGIEYEERVELVEDVSYPQPLAELLEVGFVAYARSHPWVLDERLSPKSVVRDLAERSMTFPEYVAFYGLARAEGVVLRYLADAYKALRQTVPEAARTEPLADLIAWLGELVRQVDSSLLEEWERLRNPDPEKAIAAVSAPPTSVTSNVRAFRVLVRNAMFRGSSWPPAALGRAGPSWTASGVDRRAVGRGLEPYFATHGLIQTGRTPAAAAAGHR